MLIAEIVGTLVKRAPDQCCLRYIEEAFTKTVSNDLFNEYLPPRQIWSSTVLSDFNSKVRNRCRCSHHHSSSRCKFSEKSELRRYSISDTESDKVSERRSRKSRELIDMHCNRSHCSSKEMLLAIEPVSTYYHKAVDY